MRFVFCLVFLITSHLYAQNYYNSVNTGSSQLLRSSLHNKVIDDHNVVSYESSKQHLQNTDADPNDSGNIILIYTNKIVLMNLGMEVTPGIESIFGQHHMGFMTPMLIKIFITLNLQILQSIHLKEIRILTMVEYSMMKR